MLSFKLSIHPTKKVIDPNFLPNINGNTPTIPEHAATDSDVEIVSALVFSSLYALQNNLNGITAVDDNTVKFDNVQVINPTTQEEICILYGTVKIEGTQQSKTLILDLTTGTQYKGKGHTLYAKTSSDGQIVEIKLDGYKLTNIENLFSSINDSISSVLSYLRDAEIVNSLIMATGYAVIDYITDTDTYYNIPLTGEEIQIQNTTVVLYGTAEIYNESETMIINLTDGTKYNGESHTLYAKFYNNAWQEIQLDNEPFEFTTF